MSCTVVWRLHRLQNHKIKFVLLQRLAWKYLVTSLRSLCIRSSMFSFWIRVRIFGWSNHWIGQFWLQRQSERSTQMLFSLFLFSRKLLVSAISQMPHESTTFIHFQIGNNYVYWSPPFLPLPPSRTTPMTCCASTAMRYRRLYTCVTPERPSGSARRPFLRSWAVQPPCPERWWGSSGLLLGSCSARSPLRWGTERSSFDLSDSRTGNLFTATGSKITQFYLKIVPLSSKAKNMSRSERDFSWLTVCLSWSFVITRCCVSTWVTKILMHTILNVDAGRKSLTPVVIGFTFVGLWFRFKIVSLSGVHGD